ncbi:MAG: hypothetical protein O2U61_03370 [Candidatus Bathyarchaeota archaeon]|nr:hypothetical protein [Candidatus Bathyarchaeota archaeon]
MAWFIRFIGVVSLLTNFLPLHSQPSYFVNDTTKVITKEAGHQCFPQVVFDVENYIVTWADGRRNLGSSSRSSWYMVNNSIYAGRISVRLPLIKNPSLDRRGMVRVKILILNL